MVKFVLFDDIFTSRSRWEDKGTFILESRKNSNVSGNIEKFFLRLDPLCS